MPRPRPLWAAVAVTAATACQTTGGTDTAEQQETVRVRLAYLAYWHAFIEASASAAPDHAELNRRAGGQQLATLRQNLGEARAARRVTRGDVRHDIRSVEIDGDRARVLDCVDLDGWIYHDARTGARLADQLVDKPSTLATFVLARNPEDEWVVTTTEAAGQC